MDEILQILVGKTVTILIDMDNNWIAAISGELKYAATFELYSIEFPGVWIAFKASEISEITNHRIKISCNRSA